MKKSKTIISGLIISMLIIFTVITIKYHSPVDIESACKHASPQLVNNMNSCSLIDQVRKSLQEGGYNLVQLEDTKARDGLLRGQFHLQTFEVTNYKIEGDPDIGIAHFSFINGRLSSISYFPKTPDLLFKLYPEKQSESINIKHSTDYKGRKYISWSNENLESYIRWWISKFS